MKKILLGLFLALSLNAQVADVSEINIVHNLKEDLVAGESKSSEAILAILEKYFADGCEIVVNKKGLVLKKKHFNRYASSFAMFYPKEKIDCEMKIKEAVPVQDGVDNIVCVKATVSLPKKQQTINVDFTFKDQKLIKAVSDDVPLSVNQRLMLVGLFNLLSY